MAQVLAQEETHQPNLPSPLVVRKMKRALIQQGAPTMPPVTILLTRIRALSLTVIALRALKTWLSTRLQLQVVQIIQPPVVL